MSLDFNNEMTRMTLQDFKAMVTRNSLMGFKE